MLLAANQMVTIRLPASHGPKILLRQIAIVALANHSIVVPMISNSVKLFRSFSPVILLLLSLPIASWGQVVIVSNGAETAGTTWTTSSNSFAARTTNTGTPADRIKTGSRSWQEENGTFTLVTNGASTVGYVSCFVELWVASISTTSGNGIDASDYLEVYVSNSATFSATPDVTLGTTGSNSRWGMSGTGIITTTAGTPITYNHPGGTQTGANARPKIVVNIPNGWSTVFLKVEANNNSTNEVWSIDDISLKGTVGTPDTEAEFSSASGSVGEAAGSYNLPISVANPDATATTVVTIELTAGDPSLTTSFASVGSTITATVPANTTTYNKAINISNNGICGSNGDLEFEITTVTGGQGTPAIGTQSTYVLTVDDDEGTSGTFKTLSFETGDDFTYTGGGAVNTTASKYYGTQSYRLGGSSDLTTENVDLSNYTNVTLSVAFASSGCDSGEDLFLDISYDNGSTWTGTGSIKLVDGFSNANINIGGTNASNPTTVLTNPWIVNVSNAETQIKVRLRAVGLDAGEYYWVDDIVLSGESCPCSAPSTQSSAISFSSVGTNQVDVDWTNGDGNGRVVIMNSVNTFTAPATGSNPSSNTTYAGSGQQVVYNGSGSGPITVSNLSPNTTYWFRVYEYCSPDRVYNPSTASDNPSSITTNAAATPTLSATSLTSFGSQCEDGTYGPNTFTINGSSLTSANVTVAALSGFEYATSSGGPYSSSLTLSQPGGTYSQTIYVRFVPTAATNYSGNIVVSGGGASSINVSAAGIGLLNYTPTVSIAITSGSNPTCSGNSVTFTATPASTGGGTVAYQWKNNSVDIPSAANNTYTSTSLTNGDGITCEITVTGACVTSSTALSNAIGMTVNSIPAAPVANGNTTPQVTNVNATDFTANWNAVTGATGYELDVYFSGTQTIFEEDFTGFTGAGFASSPSGAQLDSDSWKVTGMSDGNGGFGGTHTSGDFARGASAGGVITGGTYGFDVGGGNRTLGFQPGGSDFTPGTVTLRIQNNTGSTITSLDVSYTIWTYNDQDRANSLNFAHSANDVSYTSIGALDYTSTQASSGSPTWESVNRSTAITGLNIANGAYYYLRWESDDVGGSNNRDELALDDVVVTTTGLEFVTGYENLSVAGTTQLVSGLTAGETYTYRVRSVNGCGTSGNSNEVDVTTSCSAPGTHASSVSVSSVVGTTATISWTSGGGPKRIVVLREGSAVNANPADNTTYTGNTVFGSGSQIGTGNFVVYSGTGSTVNVTGLTPGTHYFAEVFEYDCSVGGERYLTTGTPGNTDFVTIPNVPTAFTDVCVSTTGAELSWAAPSIGNVDGYLLVARENTFAHSVNSLDPNTQTFNLDYSIAPTFGSTAPYSRVLYNGTGTTATVTGLTPSNSYTFRVYAYSLGSGSDFEYSTSTSLTRTAELGDVTLANAVGNDQSVLVTWTNPSQLCFDEVLVVANETSGISFTPTGDGSAYTANDNYTAVDQVVYLADFNTNTVDVSGLTNGTPYYFEIFVRNGTTWSSGVEVSAIPNNITNFGAGDMAIVAVNTQYLGSGSDDEVCFFSFQDITVGASIEFNDNGFERISAGLWGDTEGVVRITRTAGGTVTAGTTLCLQGAGNSASDFTVVNCGANDNANWSISSLNGNLYDFDLNQNDQIWLFQNGAWSNPGGSHNASYTGDVVWGWTATGWESGPGYASTAGSTRPEGTECYTIDLDGIGNNDKVKYVGSMAATDQIGWIRRINDPANWTGYSSNSNYNSGGQDYSGGCINFPFTSTGFQSGLWDGVKNTDWHDCNNWNDLRVPGSDTDVTIPFTSNNPTIFAPKTGDCYTITIHSDNGAKLYINDTGKLRVQLP